MSERAQALADRFHQARTDLITTIEGCDTERMQAQCHGEQCSVAALASHVAGVHAFGADIVRKAASGEPLPPITMDEINTMNAEQFTRDAQRSKDEVLHDLRQHGDDAEQVLRGLSDEALDRTSDFPLLDGTFTTQQIVEYVVIGDVEGHLKSIKAATQSGD